MAQFSVAYAVLACTLSGYSQPVTIKPSTIPNIELIGAQSPDFSGLVAQVVGTDQPNGFAAWIPYGVVIKNNSSQALAAITVVWTASFNGGPLGHGGANSPTWFNNPRHQLKPGQAIVMLPQSSLEQPRDLRSFADGRGMGNLQNYQKADTLQVTLDGIVFASGQFIGPDSMREYERFQAMITAPHTLATTLLQKRDSQSIGDILAWLQAMADKRSQDDEFRASGVEARGMLALYQSRGEAALYSRAQETLQQPLFPLHR